MNVKPKNEIQNQKPLTKPTQRINKLSPSPIQAPHVRPQIKLSTPGNAPYKIEGIVISPVNNRITIPKKIHMITGIT